MKVSWDDFSQYVVNKIMFQTSNQLWDMMSSRYWSMRTIHWGIWDAPTFLQSL
jgi:hypothetical protein